MEEGEEEEEEEGGGKLVEKVGEGVLRVLLQVVIGLVWEHW